MAALGDDVSIKYQALKNRRRRRKAVPTIKQSTRTGEGNKVLLPLDGNYLEVEALDDGDHDLQSTQM